MSFLGEIRRRKMFQVAAVYAVVAWLLVEIVTTIEEPLSLPEWFDTTIIVLLGIGFPLTLVISWAYNLTPEGLVRESDSGAAKPSGRSIEFVLLGLIVVAVGWLIYRVEFSDDEATRAIAGNANVAGEGGDVIVQSLGSVAVLPFVDLSAPAQTHLAHGITDELIYQLSSIGLYVPNFISALRFDGDERAASEIGAELGVDAVVTGTLAMSGDRLRIGYALTRISDGRDLVNERFDDESEDDFIEVQEQIARRIRSMLAPRFVDNNTGDRVLTTNFQALDLYHLANNTALPRTEAAISAARGHFETASRLDPEFAEAYAGMAWTDALLWEYLFVAPPETLARAVDAAEQAYALRPDSQEVLYAVALVRSYQRRWPESIELARAAVAVNEGQAYPKLILSLLLARTLQLDEARDVMRDAVRLDPLDANANRLLGQYLHRLPNPRPEDLSEAIALLEEARRLNPQHTTVHLELAEAFFRAGRDAEAAAAFLESPQVQPFAAEISPAAEAGGYFATVGRYLELQNPGDDFDCPATSNSAAELLAAIGRVEEAFSCVEQQVDAGFPLFNLGEAWLLNHERFPELIARTGQDIVR